MSKKNLPEPAALNNYDRYKPFSDKDAERAGRLVAELLTLDVCDKEAVVRFIAKHRPISGSWQKEEWLKRARAEGILNARCAIVLVHEALAAIWPFTWGFLPDGWGITSTRVRRAVAALPIDRRKGARRCDVVDLLEANNFGHDHKTDEWWRETLAPCAAEFQNLTSEMIAAERARRQEKNTVYETIAAGLSLAVGAFGDARRPKERATTARQRVSLAFRNAGLERWPRSDRPPKLPHKRRYKLPSPARVPSHDDDF